MTQSGLIPVFALFFALGASPSLGQSTNAAPVLIETTTPVDVSKLPISDQNKKVLTDSLAPLTAGTVLNTVFVASANMQFATYSSGLPTLYMGVAETARIALEICEFYSKGPCIILAINGHEARDAGGFWPPQPRMLEYDTGVKFDAWKLPFNANINRAAAALLPYQKPPAAVVLTTAGSWNLGGGATIFEAIATAMTACKKAYPNNDCLLYSINGAVVMAQ